MTVNTSEAASQLKSYIARVERLEEDKASVQEDIKGVYEEAKGNGFDVKVMKEVVKRRKMDKSQRDEHDHLLDLYERAITNQLDMFRGDETAVKLEDGDGNVLFEGTSGDVSRAAKRAQQAAE